MKRIALVGTLAILASPAGADQAAETLFKKCVTTMRHARTFQADFTWTISPDPTTMSHHGTIKLKKPDQARAEYTVLAQGQPTTVLILNRGPRQIVYDSSTKAYQHFDSKQHWAFRNEWGFGNAWSVFFGSEDIYLYKPTGSRVKIVGTLKIGGDVCKVLQIDGNTDYLASRFYIGPDNTLRGQFLRSSTDGRVSTMESRLTHVKVNVAIPDESFDWTPPADANTGS